MRNWIRGLSKVILSAAVLCAALFPWVESGQLPQPSNIAWKYSDLRAFDPPDEIDSGSDLIAIYFRESRHLCEIRLDLLASSSEAIPEAYFLVDFLPGGQNQIRIASEQVKTAVEWDFAIRLLSNDLIQIVEPETKFSNFVKRKLLHIQAKRNLDQDTVEIQFGCEAIGLELPRTKIGIILVNPNETDPLRRMDQSPTIMLDRAPPNPVNVLMFYSQTFAGKTPAQALKNWDGAHTGPESARHGLSHLVEAVDLYKVPVILVDLKSPQNLSALDAIGVLPDLARLENDGLLILPDYSFIQLSNEPQFLLPNKVYLDAFSWSRQVSKEMGLTTPPFFAAPEWPRTSIIPSYYRFVLPHSIPALQRIQVCKSGQIKFLCMPHSSELGISNLQPKSDIDSDGLTIDTRKALIYTAMRNNGEVMVLGGALAQTAWGNIGAADRVFKYIQSHPWINPLNSTDLLTWSVSPGQSINFIPSAFNQTITPDGKLSIVSAKPQILVDVIAETLYTLPSNSVTTFAYQAFYALLSTNNPRQHQLNAASLGQIGHLIYAAKWVSAPTTQLNCDIDINWDGINECIFSTKNLFASFDTIGGSLVSAFALTDTGVQQIAASSYHVANGLSDPFRWKPEFGVHGDPDAPGAALIEIAYSERDFLSRVEGNSLYFESSDGVIKKEFRLLSDRIRIDYHLTSPQIIQFQSSVNPWERYSVNWKENFKKTIVLSNMKSQEASFWQPLPYLDNPEDPNFDYGRGYFSLFPFEVFTFQASGDSWLEILIK